MTGEGKRRRRELLYLVVVPEIIITAEEQRIRDYLYSRDDWAFDVADWWVRVGTDYSGEHTATVEVTYLPPAPDFDARDRLRVQLLNRIPSLMEERPDYVHTRFYEYKGDPADLA